MVTTLKTNRAIRKELQDPGYSDHQVPDWLVKADAGAAAEADRVLKRIGPGAEADRTGC